MQIIVNEYGAKLSKCENRIVISSDAKKEEFASDNINQIIICSPCAITEGAIQLATSKNIDIVFTDFAGRPYARIYPCTLGGTTLTRREQARACISPKGVQIAVKIICGKITNQAAMLAQLNKTRNNLLNEEITKLLEIEKLLEQKSPPNLDDFRDELIGYEGYCASIYFLALNKVQSFGNRNPKSRDIFNIALNYGYGIFYNQVERSCILAGLDPYLGFIHTDRYGKPSLTLDLIEIFRPIVDKKIVTMHVQHKLNDEMLDKIGESVTLTKIGKNEILQEVLATFEDTHEFLGKRLTLKSIMIEQCREISRYLTGQHEDFEIMRLGY